MLRDKKEWRARRVATFMMVLCLLVAGGRIFTGILPAVDPRLAAAGVTCTFWRCELDHSPLRLLPQARNQPGLATDFGSVEAVIERPLARKLIATGAIIAAIPTAWLFFALALAFRAFGRRRDLTEATRWLRRAAVAALAAVVLKPLADTLKATALSPATTGKQQIFLMFEGGDFLWGVITAGTAFVAVWALDQGVRSERELAEIV